MSAIYRFVILAVVLLTPLPVLAQWGGGGRMVLPQASSQTIASTAISCGSSCSATAGTGGQVGTFSATMSPASPAFSGSWSLQTTGSVGGTSCDNSGFFSVSGNALNISSSATAATYHPCYVATQSGISNSPFPNVATVTVNSGGGNVPAVANAGCLVANGGGPTNGSCFNTQIVNLDFTGATPSFKTGASGVKGTFNATNVGSWLYSNNGSGCASSPTQFYASTENQYTGGTNPACSDYVVASDPADGINSFKVTYSLSDWNNNLPGVSFIASTASSTMDIQPVVPLSIYFTFTWKIDSQSNTNVINLESSGGAYLIANSFNMYNALAPPYYNGTLIGFIEWDWPEDHVVTVDCEGAGAVGSTTWGGYDTYGPGINWYTSNYGGRSDQHNCVPPISRNVAVDASAYYNPVDHYVKMEGRVTGDTSGNFQSCLWLSEPPSGTRHFLACRPWSPPAIMRGGRNMVNISALFIVDNGTGTVQGSWQGPVTLWFRDIEVWSCSAWNQGWTYTGTPPNQKLIITQAGPANDINPCAGALITSDP